MSGEEGAQPCQPFREPWPVVQKRRNFAERAKIGYRHFQDTEAGKVDVGYKNLCKIQRALGCDWNTMMEGKADAGHLEAGMSLARASA